jgi:hypothetical protein
MALMISRAFHLPLDVSHILESFVHREYHAALILKYGRGIVCRRARRWDLGGSTFPPMPPGFEIFAWEIDFRRLKAGMEIAFFRHTYIACVLTGVTDDAFTYLHDGVETSMLFRLVFQAFLFVISPGPYMQFVGRDRYTGDLTDLPPLQDGEQMSQTEYDIREEHYEMQCQLPCPPEPEEGEMEDFEMMSRLISGEFW